VSLHSTSQASQETRANGSSAEHAFLWIVLILALAVWVPFTVIVDSAILAAASSITFRGEGAADAGGIGWILIDIVGPMLLALGLAYGLYRYHTRDRRLDPLTEAATRDAFEHPRPAHR
jgi:hypothetical protein